MELFDASGYTSSSSSDGSSAGGPTTTTTKKRPRHQVAAADVVAITSTTAAHNTDDDAAPNNNDDDERPDRRRCRRSRHTTAPLVPLAPYGANAADVGFVRAKPHARGSWAGRVYLPLVVASSPSSSSEAARAFRAASRGAIQTFRRVLSDRLVDVAAAEREGKGGAGRTGAATTKTTDATMMCRIVPHLPMSEGDDSDDDDTARGRDGAGDRPPAGNNDGLHVSLSRPFFLQSPSISSFVADLTKRIRTLRMPPVILTFRPSECTILVNDEGTRSFLAVPAAATAAGGASTSSGAAAVVQRLIRCIDGTLRKYGQAPYYNDPMIHVSVASVAGDVTEVLAGTAYDAERRLKDLLEGSSRQEDETQYQGCEPDSSMGPVTVRLDTVRCALGTTQTFDIKLGEYFS